MYLTELEGENKQWTCCQDLNRLETKHPLEYAILGIY